MGILDKARALIGKNEEKVDDAIDKAADFADDKTGGKHTDKIEGVADKAKDVVEKLADGEK
jgi:hypothetical protein